MQVTHKTNNDRRDLHLATKRLEGSIFTEPTERFTVKTRSQSAQLTLKLCCRDDTVNADLVPLPSSTGSIYASLAITSNSIRRG